MNPLAWVAIALGVLGVAGSAVAFVVGRRTGRDTEVRAREAAGDTAEQLVKRIIGDAERDADGLRKQSVLAGKEEAMRAREEWEAEARRRREEVEREEKRLQERESVLDRKFDLVETRDKDVGKRASDLGRKEKSVEERQQELDKMVGEERRRLEQLAGLSAAEAKAELIRRMEEEAHADAANRLREIRETAKRNADREAKKIVALAVQRIAADHTAEITVSAVALPKDEMKGRIIGREGRNIRAFELATGVDVIIDDTPDSVVVSCFDPVRREVARLALEKLVADGRIHPGRIEELVEKARKEVDAGIVETGEQAAYEVNVHGIHPEIIKLIGRMKWRTSYGQNILLHSKE
ncbi:MAG TPA: Rnase Y domain-containing protein, partial [Usitatibacter sp.]